MKEDPSTESGEELTVGREKQIGEIRASFNLLDKELEDAEDKARKIEQLVKRLQKKTIEKAKETEEEKAELAELSDELDKVKNDFDKLYRLAKERIKQARGKTEQLNKKLDDILNFVKGEVEESGEAEELEEEGSLIGPESREPAVLASFEAQKTTGGEGLPPAGSMERSGEKPTESTFPGEGK